MNFKGGGKTRKYDITKGLQKFPASDPKEIETYNLSNKEFKMSI